MITCDELIEKIKVYNPKTDVQLITAAYNYSKKAHETQKRASGEDYFSHPLAVASILVDLHLDCKSIATALLHDTIEDTLTTFDEIKTRFGDEIATLVDGVTKISLLELKSQKTHQAENFRKLILAMSTDIRVLLIKLADRLHNMRTLQYLPSIEKRRNIANETIDIYAPLAERMGINRFKDELENLAFAEINKEVYTSIAQRIKFLHDTTENPIKDISKELQEVISSKGVQCQICGREKNPYSIWVKMNRQHISFEQLSDIMGFRVIVNTKEECYEVLGIIHTVYSAVPERFRDFISTPKNNDYQGIHTTVIGPYNYRIEIQIRTEEMHKIAEFGIAAHWRYKQGISQDTGPYIWLRGILEMLDHGNSLEDFLEHTKLEMFQDHVFCFTPKGRLISLPHGATPIDFAYAIHSDIGNHTSRVKINGQEMPLWIVLQNGDEVEVITSADQSPSLIWERFVTTGKARSSLRKYFSAKEGKIANRYFDLKIIALKKHGSIATLVATLAAQGCNILNVKVYNKSSDLLDIVFEIDIHHTAHLKEVVFKMQSIPFVRTVETLFKGDL